MGQSASRKGTCLADAPLESPPVSDFARTVKPLIADVPGWLTDEEGEALYELARGCTGRGE